MSSEDSLSDLMSRKRKEEPLRELDRGNELLSTSKRQRSDDVFRRELLARKDTVTSVRRRRDEPLPSASDYSDLESPEREPGREWFDVNHYCLKVSLNFFSTSKTFISGLKAD